MMPPDGAKTGGFLTPEEWFHSLATRNVEALVVYRPSCVGVTGQSAEGALHAIGGLAGELRLDRHISERSRRVPVGGRRAPRRRRRESC
jgi:hypothetical protein